MYSAIASGIYALLHGVILGIFPGTDGTAMQAYLGLSQPVISTIVGALGIVSLFVDLQTLLLCISVLFLWRAVWAIYRIWRVILEAIPAAG